MSFFLGMLTTIVLIAFSFLMFCIGYMFAAHEVKEITKGRKNPDSFWQERGLK